MIFLSCFLIKFCLYSMTNDNTRGIRCVTHLKTLAINHERHKWFLVFFRHIYNNKCQHILKFWNLRLMKLSLTDIEGSEKRNGVPTTSFFVQDLLDGYIHYSQSDHLNKEPVFDEFLFIVTDGVNKSPMQHFRINILVRH